VAGQLSSLSVYVAGPVDASPHDQFQLAIYDDSHGAPGRLLASTEAGTLVPDTWNTLPIRALVEPDTAYWLMYNTNGSSGTVNNLTYAPLSGSPLDTAIRSHHSASLVHQADRVSVIGDLTITVIAVMLLALVAARRNRRAALSLLIGFAAAMLLAAVIRETVFQPYAHYPSGHALRVSFVATGLAGLAPRWAVRVGGWFVVVLVSLAAVYAGRHYSEEVIGGVLLGWAAATSATALARLSSRSSATASGAGSVHLLRTTESGPISSCGRSDRRISL
jgi:membrane-associated phospholipid phosphatase